MNLVGYVLIVGVYLAIGVLIYGFETIIMDRKTDDYELAFIMFWPISLMAASVFQLIRFIERMFRGED